MVGETGRSMLIHLPRGFAPGQSVPLLLLLHGSTSNGAAMLEHSGLTATADRHGFIVAAPDGALRVGTGFAWNVPGVPTVAGTMPSAGDANDVAYLVTAIDWLATQRCIDRARVYATGASGGGRMSSWLGCVAADRFAAIAPVVGLRAGNPLHDNPREPDPTTCKPSQSMPIIAFAGDKDRVNPIGGGGAPYWQYTMHAAERRWATLNRCVAAPTTRWVASGIYEESYRNCRDGAAVVARIMVGGGHDWVVDNEAMWTFLEQYRR